MTAVINPVKGLHPPYHHRQYENDLQRDPDDLLKRITLTALPFLSLVKPLSQPISIGMNGLRVWNSFDQLLTTIEYFEGSEIALQLLQTTISVVALASSIFAHPIGMIVTTAQDIILESITLYHLIQRGEIENGLKCAAKIINNLLYLALICKGGIELSVVSLASQAVMLLISSVDEFQKGHLLEGIGNLLMMGARLYQFQGQFQILKRKWAIDEAIKSIYVGELHEKWRFPSDHLPVGIEVDGIKIISWNVLNNAYMDWVTTKDSQGLNGSLISELQQPVAGFDGLMQRDLVVIDMILSMMNSGQIIALQECGAPFLAALEARLPEHWVLVKSFEEKKIDQDVVLYNDSVLRHIPEQSGGRKGAYPSLPKRPIQVVGFSRVGASSSENYTVINAHVPGDPNLPSKEEFARFVLSQHNSDQVTIALGDHNFERHELIEAYQRAGLPEESSLHAPWQTNIDPYTKESKGIDLFCVIGAKEYSVDLLPDEVLPNGNLQETIDLLRAGG
jgi:hypothetical protein